MIPSSTQSTDNPREGSWFWPTTAYGTRLVCDCSGRLRHSKSLDLDRVSEVVLFRPDKEVPFGFLFTASEFAPAFERTPCWFGGRIIALRLVATADPSRMGLGNPNRGNLLCASSGFNADGLGDIVIDCLDLQRGGTFHMEPVPAWAIPSGAAKSQASVILDLLPAAQAGIMLGQRLAIGQTAVDWQALAAVMATMSEFAFSRLAQQASEDTKLASAFARSCAGDVWLKHGLTALSAWTRAREAWPTRHQIGTELDDIATAGLHGAYLSIGHKFNAAARRSVVPRFKAAVLATARDEGVYLIEWIAYYRSIKADKIVIYSNNNTDGSDELLRLFADAGIITWISSTMATGTPAQSKAYGHALGISPILLDFEWVLVVDLDEFFCFDCSLFSSLKDYINWQEFKNVDAIPLHWLIFGSNGEYTRREQGVIDRFPICLPYIDMHVKTMCRPRLFMQSHPHVPVCDERTAPIVRSSNGDLLAHQFGGGVESIYQTPLAERAWINHYFYKSAEELILKWSRNRGNGVSSTNSELQLPLNIAENYIRQHTAPDNLLDTRIQACAPRLADEVANLLAIPGVAGAYEAVKQRYTAKVASARAALLNPPTPHLCGSAADLMARLFRATSQAGSPAGSSVEEGT